MPAYVIVQLSVTDTAAYEGYKRLAEESIAAHGGTYRVRGGQIECPEGEPVTDRVVVLEFPDMPAAGGWYHSAEYQEAARIRQAASTTRQFLFVDGYDPT